MVELFYTASEGGSWLHLDLANPPPVVFAFGFKLGRHIVIWDWMLASDGQFPWRNAVDDRPPHELVQTTKFASAPRSFTPAPNIFERPYNGPRTRNP